MGKYNGYNSARGAGKGMYGLMRALHPLPKVELFPSKDPNPTHLLELKVELAENAMERLREQRDRLAEIIMDEYPESDERYKYAESVKGDLG